MGGEVGIAIESVNKGAVIAGKTVSANSVLIAVRNKGIGIPEAVQDKIFTKFFRADNAKKQDPNGNGLGLYMAKIMMGIIDGDIWFSSKEGGETTFYLLLPKEAPVRMV